LPRKTFSFGNDAVSYLVRVRLALASFLSLRPATELGVAPRGPGLGLARSTPKLSGYLAGIRRPFVTALRTFHRPQSTALNAYESCTKSK
jgi:hypothetical protein